MGNDDTYTAGSDQAVKDFEHESHADLAGKSAAYRKGYDKAMDGLIADYEAGQD